MSDLIKVKDLPDRELLILAAKAVDVSLREIALDGSYSISTDGRKAWTKEGFYWCPFDSDGDAFRLAVKLGLNSGPFSYELYLGQDTSEFTIRVGEKSGLRIVEEFEEDPFARTRRAIVVAAATIYLNKVTSSEKI